MPTADASTPAPTYGTLASSSSPCTVPSSPYGPCSTGKTTSSADAGHDAAPSDRRAIGRRSIEQRVAAGMRDEVRLAARTSGARFEPRVLDDVGRRHRASAAASAASSGRPSRCGSATGS